MYVCLNRLALHGFVRAEAQSLLLTYQLKTHLYSLPACYWAGWWGESVHLQHYKVRGGAYLGQVASQSPQT